MVYDLQKHITKLYKEKAKVGWTTDYEYKAKVLSTDAEKLLNNLSSHLIAKNCSQEFVNNSLRLLYSEYSIFHLKEALRIHDARVHRVSRLKKRISKICKSRAYFLTLTFTDDVLDHTTESTRRTYVRKYLNKVSDDFVANIDYGSKNDREHYHAVIKCDYLDYSFWEFGIMYAEVITSDDKSFTLLSKYVSKLTNHAIKETTKRHSMIYSRKKYKSVSD